MALNDITIDDEIAADWKAIQAKHAVEEPEPIEAAPEEVVEEAKVDVPREPDGKFAKKEAEEKPVEAKAEKPVAEKAPAPDAKAPGSEPTELAPLAQQRDINRAPSSWKPQAKAIWDKLPTDIRQEVHRREADFLNGQSQLLPDAQLGKSLREVIAPYQALIGAEGGTPERAVGQLLNTAALFRMGTPEQKLNALKSIAQQYGIPLTDIAPATTEATPGFQDPRVDRLLAQMQQEQLERRQAEQARLSAENENIQRIAAEWMSAADATGKPLRPYIDNVMSEMQALVPQIRGANPSLSHIDVLQQAYDRACRANPDTWQIISKEQIEAAEAARRTENQQRVQQAKRASSVNVTRRGSTPNPAAPGSMEDTIRETARTLGMLN
jgi:hypothetical protein